MIRKLIFILILVPAAMAARGQYFFQFINQKEGKVIQDLSVHLTRLSGQQVPVYGFFLSDANGMVQVKDSGTYFLQVIYPTYEVFQDTIRVVQPGKPYVFRLRESDFTLRETVVTGEYEIKTTDQSLNRIKVIDRKKIERQGAVNLRDLLSNELNIRMSTDNVLGTSLSLQGVSGQNVKILIDGVPIIGRMDGKLDLSQINLGNIERVEIIEGPMSVIYGTDALGGVINLITKKSTSHTLETGLGTYYESNGTYNGEFRMAVRRKSMNAQVNAARNFFQGLPVPGEIRSRTWKPREQYLADAILGFKIKNSLHRIQAAYFTEKMSDRGEPVFQPYQIYAFDQYFFTSRLTATLNSDFRLGAKKTLNLINSYSDYNRVKRTYRKDLVALKEVVSPDPEQHDTARFDLWLFRGIYTNNQHEKLNYQAGYDINLESGAGDRIGGGNQRIYDFAAFGTMEWKPDLRWSVKPGLRASYNTRYPSPLVPSLNLKYDLNSMIQIRASYAKGFRAPGLKELNLLFVDVSHNIQGNQDLRAEHSENFSLSFNYAGKFKKWNWKLDGAGFYNDIRNMISLAMVNPQTQLYTYLNIGKFRTAGYNLSADFRKEGLSLSAGYARIGRFNELGINTQSWTPEYRLNATYLLPYIYTDFSMFCKITGVTPGYAVENNQVYQTRIDSYTNLDMSLSRSFAKKTLHVVAGCKNVLDVMNVNISGANGGSAHGPSAGSMPVNMGRTFFASVKYNLIRFK